MIYLLDANVLIDANRNFYGVSNVPEFWEWLIHKGESGEVKIPVEIYEEFSSGTDDLAKWAKNPRTKKALQLNEDVSVDLIRRVVKEGYAEDLTDSEIEELGRDPFLMAYALYDKDERCVVTTEAIKPTSKRANRRIPNVCEGLNLRCLHAFEFYKELHFKTSWKESSSE